MSIGIRVMFVDGDRIIRVPLRRFDRLFDRDLNEAMPEYAGQRVRCAMVYVELADRKPVEVVRIDYMVLPLDPEGRVDADLQSRKLMLAGGYVRLRDDRHRRTARRLWAVSGGEAVSR